MSYYLRVVATLSVPNIQVWKIENETAIRIGITNAEQGPGTFFKANPGETIWDALRRQTPWFESEGQARSIKLSFNRGSIILEWRGPLTSILLKPLAGALERNKSPAGGKKL